ncbi:MAG: hypothetical protein ABJD53_18455 [Gammaproteobacteria bacterium]
MNQKLLLYSALALTAVLVTACHGNDHAATPAQPAPPTSVALSTADVLALAQHTSESDAPFAVNDGKVTLNDTSETSAPIPVTN